MKKYTVIFTFLLFYFSAITVYAQSGDFEIDSLIAELPSQKEDSSKTILLNKIAFRYYKYSPDTTILYADSALQLSKLIKYKKGEAHSLKVIGIACYVKSDFQKALEYYISALEISEKIRDKKNMLSLYNNIGLIYLKMQDFTEALSYMEKASKMLGNSNKTLKKASILLNIGTVYDQIDSTDQALDYYNKSYKIRILINDSAGMAKCANNIAYVLFKQDKFKESLPYFLSAEKILETKDDYFTIATIYINIARVYLNTDRFSKAEMYYEKAMKSAILSNSEDMKMEVYNDLYQFYEKIGLYKQAFSNHLEFVALKDSIYSEEKTKIISELQTKYEVDKNKRENLYLKEKEAKSLAELKQQKYFSFLIMGVLAFTVIIAFLLLRTGLQRKKANTELAFKNTQINQQKEEILTQNEFLEQQKEEIQTSNNALQQKNDEVEYVNSEIIKQKNVVEEAKEQIVASINYASNIQKAMLPSLQLLENNFENFFIFYEPRDIVSGDFYWFKNINNIKVIAIADCTGHGVPGAFVSMLGISLLNEIIVRNEITKVSDVMDELRTKLINSLNQASEDNDGKDGMDLALCAIDVENLSMQYAGANNSLYIFRKENNKNIMLEYKADRQPVGMYVKPKPFTNHIIKLKKNDVLYMFSDGYQDQFGGKRLQKFKINKLRNLILSIQDKSIKEQEIIIKQNYYNWKGETAQIDDVLLMAIKI